MADRPAGRDNDGSPARRHEQVAVSLPLPISLIETGWRRRVQKLIATFCMQLRSGLRPPDSRRRSSRDDNRVFTRFQIDFLGEAYLLNQLGTA